MYTTNYGTYSTYNNISNSDLNALYSIFATIVGLGAFFFFIVFVLGIVTVIGQWKVFKKAGKEGCLALIPVAGFIEELRIGKINIAYFFLNLTAAIPLIGFIGPLFLYFWKNIRLAKAFGKETGTGILLSFFPFVMYPILGFGNATYVGLDEDKKEIVD